MDRATRNAFAFVLVIVIALTGGAALVLSGNTRDQRPNLPSVTGVIVAVDSAGLSNVRSFTLRQAGGASSVFALSELQDGIRFPPGHLNEHLATARPVQVWYRDAGGTLFAVWLEDAP